MKVRPVEIASMRTRDGLRLDADIYRPEGIGPWPVLLLRQAYGRRIASTVSYAHPSWYAAQGYVVVVQDVRGRGTSEGFFQTLEHEDEDGAAAIAWCAELQDTTGEVGMYGFSYQGINQLLAAAKAGKELKAIAPAMIGWDLMAEVMQEGGVPQLSGAIGWAAQLGADTARHENEQEAYEALKKAANTLPLDGSVTAQPEILKRYAHFHHYERWRLARAQDPMWRRISPNTLFDALKERGLPMLFIGGWYDSMLPGTLAGWAAMSAKQPDRTQLVVGPWAHLPWGQMVGGFDFGPNAVSNIDRLQIAWFDHWLKAKPLEHQPMRLFNMGTRSWTTCDSLCVSPTWFHLAGDGRASIDTESGLLVSAPQEEGLETFVHDPWRPAPTRGGRFGNPAGPLDRRETDQRGDVVTFTSAPLGEPLEIRGWLIAELYVEADCPSFDLHCTVSRLCANGSVLPFAEGAKWASTGRITIDLMACCITLARGERLRLSVAGANYPAFAVNPGFDDRGSSPHMKAGIITISIRHGKGVPSALIVNAERATR